MSFVSLTPSMKTNVEGKQNPLFLLGPVIMCFVKPSNSKIGKKTGKNYLLEVSLHNKFATVSRCTTGSSVSQKFKFLFPGD